MIKVRFWSALSGHWLSSHPQPPPWLKCSKLRSCLSVSRLKVAEEEPTEDSGARGQPPGGRRPSSESASEMDSSRVLSEKVWNRPIRNLSPEVTLGVEDTRLYFSSRILRS